jgi:hypothetical protein
MDWQLRTMGGAAITGCACDRCQGRAADREPDYSPPSAYGPALKALREQQPASLPIEAARIYERTRAKIRRNDSYEAPDGYAHGIRALQIALAEAQSRKQNGGR